VNGATANSKAAGNVRELPEFIRAGGHRLEYRRIVPEVFRPGAPTLVFLHEGLGSLALWKDFPDRVVQASGCPALVYSRYGYGKSEKLSAPRSVDYMHREALDVLPELLAALSIVNPVLVGHSDGASIALIHAGAGKWPVRGLVLMAPHVFVEEVTVQSIEAAKVAFDGSDLPIKLGRYHDDVQSAFRGWNDIWLDPSFRHWNIEEYLSSIACPLLAIQGENDQYGSIAQIEAIRKQVIARNVGTLLLPNCGHSPQVDQREPTLRAITEFVAALPPLL
jgi:pimeloyl-ACP methyl ester carboxylesterase